MSVQKRDGRASQVRVATVRCRRPRSLALAGSQLFYVVEGPRGLRVVHGSRRAGPYDEIRDLCAAGPCPFYAARRGGCWHIVWGARESRSYERLHSWCLAGDGHPLYLARRRGLWRMVWGFSEGPAFDAIRFLGFAGGKPYYVGLRDGRLHDMRGREELRAPASIFLFPGLEREVRRLAARYEEAGIETVRARGGWRVRWKGGRSRVFDEVGHVLLAAGRPLFGARRHRRWRVVHGSTEGPAFDGVFSLEVDGGFVRYGARKDQSVVRITQALAS